MFAMVPGSPRGWLWRWCGQWQWWCSCWRWWPWSHSCQDWTSSPRTWLGCNCGLFLILAANACIRRVVAIITVTIEVLRFMFGVRLNWPNLKCWYCWCFIQQVESADCSEMVEKRISSSYRVWSGYPLLWACSLWWVARFFNSSWTLFSPEYPEQATVYKPMVVLHRISD